MIKSFLQTSPTRKAKPKFVNRTQRIEAELKNRVYPYRYLFVLVDNQDLFANDNLQLIKVEVNSRLCRIIPQKTWESKAARTLSFQDRLQLSNPSKLLQEQVLLEVIDEINQRMPDLKHTMYYAWTLQGQPVTSLLDLHTKCQIIVVSPEQRFRGIRGMERFDVEPAARPHQDTTQVHPKPRTWIQGQTISWIRQNDTTNAPNLTDTSGAYAPNTSQDFMQAETSVVLMEALREEHERVHN
jgi:hypothetical protein